ncbi:MAG: sulfotransferase [Bacteroidales bacterium]|nr:sulfotransferase [Bacteroidales bacterium]
MKDAIRKPNFFVVGAAKAGTTSLYYYLNQHPEIYLSPLKEPNFFSTDINPELFSDTYRKNNQLDYKKYFSVKPLNKLQLSFVREEEYYNLLFEDAKEEKIIGECSTSYLFSNEAAGNIFEYNPKAKILITIRNPIERAYSHYLMALRYGYTSLNFNEAINKDINAIKKGWGISELFIELGQYSQQISRYYEVFGKENVLVLLFEELKNNLEGSLGKTFEFLNVKGYTVKNSEVQNSAKVPRFRTLNKFFVHSGIKNLSTKMLPSGSKEKLKSALYKNAGKMEMKKEDRDFLLRIFETEIKETSVLINKDLSSWTK